VTTVFAAADSLFAFKEGFKSIKHAAWVSQGKPGGKPVHRSSGSAIVDE
jgi:hypothetical protein